VNLLVVGDWFVDENWIVTEESLATSSHVGRRHYRSRIEDPDAQILSLCGAGGVASLLHGLSQRMKEEGKTGFGVFGLGAWDQEDTRFVASLLDAGTTLGQTPQTLHALRAPTDQPRTNRAHQTAHCLSCLQTPCKRMRSLGKPGSGTWRVIRVYQRTGNRAPELLNRYDWEIRRDRMPGEAEIESAFKPTGSDAVQPLWRGTPFTAIVVVDHCKGLVSPALVANLRKAYPTAKWYARCKDPGATWLRHLPAGLALELLVLGPRGLESSGESWFLGRHISEDAITFLSSQPSRRTVALHHDNHVAALERTGLDQGELLVCLDPPPPLRTRVGRTTVLFSALLADLAGLRQDQKDDFKASLGQSLAKAHRWCKEIEQILGERIARDHPSSGVKHECVDFRSHFGHVLSVPIREAGHDTFALSKVKEQKVAWELSRQDIGTLPRSRDRGHGEPTKKLQLWRGWSPVIGFMALSPDRRRDIARLVKAATAFADEDREPTRSLATMLVAPPGLGKSFLVQRLADAIRIGVIEFNITHLTSIGELIACFDMISSRQNQEPRRRLVVFWDEINAQLGGEHVYSYFLGPMSDGVYRRGGLTFRLQPCIWIFAGTRLPEEAEQTKGSDFRSRLNGPVITLKADEPLEQLYTAVALIRRQYPDVNQISEGLLRFLLRFKPKYGVRSLDFLASQLRNVHHGTVRVGNLPDPDDMESWAEDPSGLTVPKEDGSLVFIYDEPPAQVIPPTNLLV